MSNFAWLIIIVLLLPFASEIESVDAAEAAKLTPEILREIVELIPDEWLDEPNEQREVYFNFLTDRLTAPREFVREAIDARRNLHI